MNRRLVTLLAGVFALSTFASSCSALKDPEPFTADLTLSEGIGGSVTINPRLIRGDTSFGEISVHNETNAKHGFAIRELAIFEEIQKGESAVVALSEARDGKTYIFECHIHDDPPEYRGELVIEYVDEKERR